MHQRDTEPSMSANQISGYPFSNNSLNNTHTVGVLGHLSSSMESHVQTRFNNKSLADQLGY